MIAWIALVAALFLAIPAESQESYASLGNIPARCDRIFIYGDSFNNENEMVADLAAAMSMDESAIFSMGEGGTKIYDPSYGGGGGCGEAGGDEFDCRQGVHSVTRYSGTCESFSEFAPTNAPAAPSVAFCTGSGNPIDCCTGSGTGTCRLSCIEDIGAGPTDCAILMYGVNDAYYQSATYGDGVGCTGNPMTWWKRDWRTTLDALDAADVWSVVTTSIETAEINPGTQNQNLVVNQECMRDALRDEIVPEYSKVVYAESFDAWRQYRSDYGVELWLGLYNNCPTYPCESSPYDGIHPAKTGDENANGDNGYSFLVEKVIHPALLELLQKRGAAY